MSITVAGRKMPVTDALRDYAEEKIGNSMKVMDIDPLVAEIVLYVEKNPANPRPACCEVTLRTKGHIVRVEECEEDMYAAIDVAAAKVYEGTTPLTAQDVADTAYWVATRPAHININHLEMMPTCQGYGALNIKRVP